MKEITDDRQRKMFISTNAAQQLHNEFSGSVLSLLSRTMKNRRTLDKEGNMKVKRDKYPPELRSFALTLNFYSTRAYNYVRETFDLALPHVSTIRSWYAEVNGEPGWNEEAFNGLKEKAKHCNAKGKKMICALMFDEVGLKRHTEYDGKKYYGYVDVGGGAKGDNDKEEATSALVFMVVSMNDHWKCPIGYFLVNGLSAHENANLVNESPTRLHAIGVDVRSCTFDGPSSHFSMCEKLGANMTANNPRPWFAHPCHPNKRVFLILDPCHMLKLIRNHWCALKIIKNAEGEEISWYFIEELHKIKEQEGAVLGNKLRRAHIEWKKKNMKVKLAAQLLSRSVADALEFLNVDLKIPEFKGCKATVKFIRTINDLFDLLNSRNPFGRGCKSPLRKQNEYYWRPKMTEAMSMLKSLATLEGQLMFHSRKKAGFLGMFLDAVAFQELFNDCCTGDEPILAYLLGYKLSQDHLELFFCAVRAKGGWNNNNPTARFFECAFKRLLHHQHIKGTNGNVDAMDETRILHVTSSYVRSRRGDITVSQVNQVRSSNAGRGEESSYFEDISEEEMLTFPESPPEHLVSSEVSQNITAYRAGYVVRMAWKKCKCADCLAALTDSDSKDPRVKLIRRKTNGGLQIPSSGVINICEETERAFKQAKKVDRSLISKPNFAEKLVNTVVRQLGSNITNLFPRLSDHQLDLEIEDDHVFQLAKTVSMCYTRCLMFPFGRDVTESFNNAKVNLRAKLTRTIINYHL